MTPLDITKTQAAGLDPLRRCFDSVFSGAALPDVPQMIADGQRKAQQLSRMDDLVDIANFIGTASLLECKHIINALIDRVSTLDGLAPELEDAACSLTRSIEIDRHHGSYMEARDEA